MRRVLPSALARAPRRWDKAPIAAATWVVFIAVAPLLPVIVRGEALGPFDLLYSHGLTTIRGVTAQHYLNADQITQSIPWSWLSWQAVHHGQLPLWNPFNALGTPLASNFQSAPFSLSSLVAYLGPLKQAYLVETVMKSLTAGLGVLVLGRCLRLSLLASVFAATAFELSGAFLAWLGWAQAGAVAWLPWMLAASYCILEGRRRSWFVAALALATGFCAYAGHPETLLMNLGFVMLFVGLFLAAASVTSRGRAHGPSWRQGLGRAGGVLGGLACGLLLAAPLLLPGVRTLQASIRYSTGHGSQQALPLSYLGGLLLPGFHGFPITKGTYTAPINYTHAAISVGAIAVVLGLTAVFGALRSRTTILFGVLGLFCLLFLFFKPFSELVTAFPVSWRLHWALITMPLALFCAVLSGWGVEVLLAGWRTRRIQIAFGAATALTGLGLLGLWLSHLHHPLEGSLGSEQARSLLWPLLALLAATAALAVFVLSARAEERGTQPGARPRSAGSLAVVALVVLGLFTSLLTVPRLWSSSPKFFATTPAVASLERATGAERVGFGGCQLLHGNVPGTGILVDSNIAYEVSEFAAYDPVITKALFESYERASGAADRDEKKKGAICPSITSAQMARHFGVAFVLEPPGAPGPPGTTFVKTIRGEGLFSVPGGGLATLSAQGAPLDDAGAHVLSVARPAFSKLVIDARAAVPSTLYVHEEASAGWHVSVDGRPVPFARYDGVMLKITLTKGNHHVALSYLPASFTWGVVLALLTLVALGGWIAVDRRRPRRGRVSAGDLEEVADGTKDP